MVGAGTIVMTTNICLPGTYILIGATNTHLSEYLTVVNAVRPRGGTLSQLVYATQYPFPGLGPGELAPPTPKTLWETPRLPHSLDMSEGSFGADQSECQAWTNTQGSPGQRKKEQRLGETWGVLWQDAS